MFKVGDLVIGNQDNDYTITHAGSICLVLKVDEVGEQIRVRLISDSIAEYESSIPEKYEKNEESFWVDYRFFDLFANPSTADKLTGLFFKKDVKKLVTLKEAYVNSSKRNNYIYIGEV